MNAIGKVILAALGLGLACGIAVGIAMYVCIGDRYTAYSILHISMQPESLVGGDVPLVDRDRFDIYKNTQRESLLRRTVLLSALRKPEVKDIPIVQEKTLYGDPVEWLAGKLSVSFPGDAEIMTVSLTLEDPKEAQALVKAVVDSYMNEVVLAETEQKRRRLDELEKICGDKEQQIRGKREELKGLVGSSIGSEDPDSLSTRQRLVLEELAIYRNEKAKIDFEIAKLKGELAAQRALLKQIDTASADPGELETLVNSDPRARELSAKLAKEQPDQPRDKERQTRGEQFPASRRRALRAQYDARVKELGQKAREKKHAVVMRKIVELEAQLKSMEEARAVTAARIGKLTEEARNIGPNERRYPNDPVATAEHGAVAGEFSRRTGEVGGGNQVHAANCRSGTGGIAPDAVQRDLAAGSGDCGGTGDVFLRRGRRDPLVRPHSAQKNGRRLIGDIPGGALTPGPSPKGRWETLPSQPAPLPKGEGRRRDRLRLRRRRCYGLAILSRLPRAAFRFGQTAKTWQVRPGPAANVGSALSNLPIIPNMQLVPPRRNRSRAAIVAFRSAKVAFLSRSERRQSAHIPSSPTAVRKRLRVGLACLMVLAASLCGCTPLKEYIQNGFKVGPNYCPPPRPWPGSGSTPTTSACEPTPTI